MSKGPFAVIYLREVSLKPIGDLPTIALKGTRILKRSHKIAGK